MSIWPKPIAMLAVNEGEVGLGDEELADLTDEGERFALIYQRYVTPIYRYCYLKLGRREAAEDATSEVFAKALAGLASYRGGAVAGWLFRIAHNVIVDTYRTRQPNANIDDAEEVADDAPTAEQRLLDQATYAEVRAAIASLPEEQRTVLELSFSGWHGQQIADALGRSHGAVRMLRLRAIARLREILRDEQ